MIQSEKERTSSIEAQEKYLMEHHDRFLYSLELCKEITASPESRVLDIGRSYFTSLLAEYYNDVTSMGFALETDSGGHREKEQNEKLDHIVFDLTDSKGFDKWPEVETKFDLIVYAETIEHIHIAPEFTLLMLHSLLSDKGKLVITTPNAVAFHKRIRLMLGMNPYEKLRFFDQNPGHYREYTMPELKQMCEACGYKVYQAIFKNFSSINPFSSLRALKYLAIKPLEYVPVFKDTLILVAEKSDSIL